MGSSDAVLRLRAGLNVAALSCRGHGMAPVTAAYGDLLNRHRTLLASAYDEERRRHGLTAFDRQQTRLYNRFANQQSPETFCRSAAAIAGQANSMASSSLEAASPRLAAALEAQLR